LKEIHKADVLHRDIYSRNMHLVRGIPIGWIDCDVATTFTEFGPGKLACCGHEIALVKGLGTALARASSLPILETFRVLTGEYRKMTRLRDSRRIQKFIEGFNGL
jgi:hypothetical protein